MPCYGTATSRRFLLATRPVSPGARLAAAIIAVGLTITASPASAMSIGSPALWNLFASATARALRAMEPPEKPEHKRPVFLYGDPPPRYKPLNQTIGNGVRSLKREAPTWLRPFDAGVNFWDDWRQDMQAAYHIAAAQPLFRLDDDSTLEARGRFVYDTAGLTSGQIGLGYRGSLRDEPLDLAFYTTAEEHRISDAQRYIFSSDMNWNGLHLHGRFYNHVASRPPPGKQLREAAVDGYHVDINAPVPTLSWARVFGSTFWHAPLVTVGQPFHGSSVGLRLLPHTPLVIETGTNANNRIERQWFARLRLQLKLP